MILIPYLWNFGDGTSGSTITNPVHSYIANGYYTVTLTARAGAYSDTLTKTRAITVAEVIFADGFDTGNFAAWSAAVTDTGRLSVTTAAAMSGTYGMQAVITSTSTTAKYVRDDTPLAEPRYRARFYFNPNSIAMNVGDKTHDIFAGRDISGTGIFTVQLRYTGSAYQIGAQLIDDASTITSTAWYTVTNAKHSIETDWKAATAAGANNGYLTLWIDGVQQENKTGIDNDTRRVDEMRLGPLNGIDTGTSGTEYFDTFESRRSTYIGPVGATAAFSANPVQGSVPLTVTFTNASQPTATITAYLWNFGDGYTSTITNPLHLYNAVGYFSVTLSAWAGSNRDILTKTNFITTTVKADFSANPVRGSAPLTVTFTNASQPTATITSYLWNFGDGYTSTITNPLHLYNSAGYFTVTLSAWAGSNRDILTRTNWITTVQAGFSANPVQGSVPLTVTFTNASQPAAMMTAYLWNFGDGYTSTITNPLHLYNSAGYFTVTLSAWAGSDQSIVTRTNFITATPKAGFSANPVQGLAPLTVTFTNTSQPTATITSYLWNFGDGYTSTITNPLHLYNSPGYFTVTLTARAGSMQDILTRTKCVTATLLANFTASPVEGNLPLSVTFTNTSQPLGAMTAYRWNFGDGYTSSITNPVHAYTTAGYFTVTLTAWAGVMQNAVTKTNFITTTDNSPVSGDFLIFGKASGTGLYYPQTAYNTVRNEFLAVWEDRDFTNVSIVGQRLSSSGHLLGATLVITSGDQTMGIPQVAYDPSRNRYLIIWRTGVSVEGRIISGDGTLGSFLDVSTLTPDNQGSALAVAYNPLADGYLVAWSTDPNGDNRMRGQIISGAGNLTGDSFVLGEVAGYDTAIAVNPINGDWLAIWCQGQFVSARQVYSDGTPSASGFDVVPGTGGNKYQVALAVASSGEYLAAWPSGQTNSVIDGRRISINGALLGNEIEIAADSYNNWPAIAYRPEADEFLVTWDYYSNDSTGYDVYGRYVPAAGSVDTPPFAIAQLVGSQTMQMVTYGAQSRTFMLVWSDTGRGGSSKYAIYGQRWVPPIAGFNAAPVVGASPLTVTFTNATTPTTNITYTWNFGDGGLSNAIAPSHTYTLPGFMSVMLTATQVDGSHFSNQSIQVNPALGQAVAVAADPQIDETTAALAYNSSDQEYLAIWTTWDPVNESYSVAARRVISTGLPVSSAVSIPIDGSYPPYPAVAYGNGVYLMIWEDGTDIQGQLMQASDVLMGDPFLIANGSSINTAPAIDYNPIANEFLVTWVHDDSGNNDIHAQRVSTDGQLLGSVITVASTGGSESHPAVAHDAAGNYLIAFMCDETPDQFAICDQQVSSGGSLIGSATKVYGAPTNSVNPDLVYDPQTDEYLVVWREGAGTASDEVYARRVSSDGTVAGGAIALGAQSGDPSVPKVAYHPDSQTYVVVWSDQRNGNWDAYVRPVQADGTLPDDASPLENSAANQTGVAISKQGANYDLLVAYTDDGSGSPDLYAERYIPPAALFSATPSSGPLQLTVNFADQSTVLNPVSWAWNFGDGATSAQQNPTHTYTALGQFTVVLTVTSSAKGYTNTGMITVNNPVSAQFSGTPVTGVRPLTVTFTDQSTTTYGTLNAWQWDFGDKVTSTQRNPTHVYSVAGSFAVKLTASTGSYTDTEEKIGYVTIPVPNQVVITYTYDGLNRLTQATSTGAVSNTFGYAYDAVGNRTAQTATITSTQVTTYAYDAANRLSAVSGQPYTWDNNGNLINDGSALYRYDQANRMISTTLGSTTSLFNYNADGARLKQIVNSTVTTYTQDLAAPLPVVLQSKTGTNVTRYVYALGTRPLAQNSTGWEYLLADALGSVRQIVDANGKVTLAESYEPYGSVLTSNGTASSIFGYSGEEADTSGLIYLRARYMHPGLSMFLSRDPWSGDGARPGSMNGWGYVKGNPVNFSDPSGRCAQLFGWLDSDGLFTRENCDRLEAGDLAFTKEWYYKLADHYEKVEGWKETAANFRHFLDGSGGERKLDSDFVRDGIIGSMKSVQDSLGSLINWYIAKEIDKLPNCTDVTVGPDGFARGFDPNYSEVTLPGSIVFGNKELYVASALGTFRMDAVLSGRLNKQTSWWIDADLDVKIVVLDYYDWHNGLFVQYYSNVIPDKWAARLQEAGMAANFFIRGEYSQHIKSGAGRYIIGWPGEDPWGGWFRSSAIGRGFDPTRSGIDYSGKPYP